MDLKKPLQPFNWKINPMFLKHGGLTSVYDLGIKSVMIVYSHWALKKRKKKISIKSRIMKSREILYGAAKIAGSRGEKGKRDI